VHPIWDAVSGTGDKEDCTEALRAQSLFRSPLAGANRDAAPEHAIEASASPTPTSSMGLTPAFTPANPVVGWANEGVCDGLPDSFVIAGWKRYASRSTDRPFFRNRKTGETRWTCPHCDPDSKVIRGQAAAAQAKASFSRLGTSAFAVAEAAEAAEAARAAAESGQESGTAGVAGPAEPSDEPTGTDSASVGRGDTTQVQAENVRKPAAGQSTTDVAREYKSLPKDELFAKLDCIHKQQGGFGDGSPWKKVKSAIACTSAFRRATWGSALIEEEVCVGLVVESKPPHNIVSVDNVVDEHYLRQGSPGYSNVEVTPGDRLVAVDGKDCASAGGGNIDNLMRGAANTLVELTLSQKNSNTMYTVRVMRQRKDVDLDTDLVKDEELDDLAAAETRAPSIASRQGGDHVDQVGKKSHMPLPERQEPGFVGLQLAQAAPFHVTAVKNMMDTNLVKQGMPGYSNQEVSPGDRIIAVDGRECVSANLADIHKLLKGFAYTEVELTLARRSSGAVYTIRVMRHPAEAMARWQHARVQQHTIISANLVQV